MGGGWFTTGTIHLLMDYQPGAKSQQHCNKIEVTFFWGVGQPNFFGVGSHDEKKTPPLFFGGWMVDPLKNTHLPQHLPTSLVVAGPPFVRVEELPPNLKFNQQNFDDAKCVLETNGPSSLPKKTKPAKSPIR